VQAAYIQVDVTRVGIYSRYCLVNTFFSSSLYLIVTFCGVVIVLMPVAFAGSFHERFSLEVGRDRRFCCVYLTLFGTASRARKTVEGSNIKKVQLGLEYSAFGNEEIVKAVTSICSSTRCY
jgi:hypothetical protein